MLSSGTARIGRSGNSQIGRTLATTVQGGAGAVVVGCAAALGGREHGSIVRGSWLPYSIVLALVAATVLLAGVAARPSRIAWVGIASLTGVGLSDGLSAVWGPSPALARDEGFLTITYALALGIAVVTRWTE